MGLMGRFYKAGFAAAVFLLAAFVPAYATPSDMESRCWNVYLMRAMESLVRNCAENQAGSAAQGCRLACDNNRMLENLSRVCLFEESLVLPFSDAVKTARHIDSLLDRLEKGGSGETAQSLSFNIAYEYLLMYLSFLDKQSVLRFQSDNDMMREVALHDLITGDELAQYLLQARIYLEPLGVYKKNSGSASSSVRYSDAFKHTGNISYRISGEGAGLYINVEFLALMLECEKLASRPVFAATAGVCEPDVEAIRYYDRKTWEWLNEMWKRHCFKQDASKGNAPVAAASAMVCPSPETLEALYTTYLYYHFIWRYILGSRHDSLFSSSIERLVLERLYVLGKENGKDTSIYSYYRAEAARDGGNTDFLAPLFFARRGYSMATLVPREKVLSADLFRIYGSFFKDAAALIRNNIPYRSRIYNELVLFGTRLDNLELMEKELYPYALDSMRIAIRDDYSGTELARSSRLTAAFLIAKILDAKSRSGLLDGTGNYREMVDMLAPLLVASDNDNWIYAVSMHRALAGFYSTKNAYFNESLAMYHAKQAFLAACRKVYTTYGRNGWRMFFSMPGKDIAVSSLKSFLDFRDKYPTNPEVALPVDFNAQVIVEAWNRNLKTGNLSAKEQYR